MQIDPFILREHERSEIPDFIDFADKHENCLVGPPDYMQTPKHLGIDSNLTASYYIGADWLEVNKSSVVVLPKMDNINFIEMFLQALSVDSPKVSDYFAHCYGISCNEALIKAPKELNQLSPILLVHYIVLVERLVKSGLKKDYITIEENLKCKIKGHIMISTHINHNIIPRREDRVFCRYQEYTEDIPVNRLLKKALLFAQQMLLSLPTVNGRDKLQVRLNALISRFENISDEVSISEVHNIGGNKLFRKYRDAVDVAKTILRRYSYSITEVNGSTEFTPPFWIDMARLFELYVYSILDKTYPGQIGFQIKGHLGTQVDYIHRSEKLIMDAKYKPRYEYSMSGIVPDIREISGYARDSKILRQIDKSLPDSIEEVRSIIIYPFTEVFKLETSLRESLSADEIKELTDFENNTQKEKLSQSLWGSATPLPWFRNFRKIGILLPTIQ